MKTLFALALGAVLTLSAGSASAQPGYPQRYPAPGYGHGHGDYRDRTEAKAQARLRQLGYYHGRIDGSFGPQSRRALVRFQRDHRLPMTGRLDYRTLHALRIR